MSCRITEWFVNIWKFFPSSSFSEESVVSFQPLVASISPSFMIYPARPSSFGRSMLFLMRSDDIPQKHQKQHGCFEKYIHIHINSYPFLMILVHIGPSLPFSIAWLFVMVVSCFQAMGGHDLDVHN